MSGLRGKAAVAVLLAVAGCVHGPSRAPETERARPGATAPGPGAEAGAQVGLASFYGRRFHGRRTASGARYDMHALTCAHRTAPFGTRLRVTALESGRSVVVTVTDRGPFKRGRVVDLSLAAARRIGMVRSGLMRVRVEPEGD